MVHLLNPYTIAQAIHALDSRLLAIELDKHNDQARLIYRYEVAGRIEPFYVVLTSEPVDSIVTLYPAAQPFEEALHHCYGIEFRPPTALPSTN